MKCAKDATSLEELTKAKERQECRERQLKADSYEERQVRRQISRVDEMADLYKRLNGTKRDLAADDPTRVVLSEVPLVNLKNICSSLVGGLFSFSLFGPVGRPSNLVMKTSGVALLSDDGRIEKLDCKSEKTKRMWSDHEYSEKMEVQFCGTQLEFTAKEHESYLGETDNVTTAEGQRGGELRFKRTHRYDRKDYPLSYDYTSTQGTVIL